MSNIIDEFVEMFKTDPELRKLPLPEYVYKKYNIPKPDVLELNSYISQNMRSSMAGGEQYEIREADDKGVRKMPYLSTVEGLDLSGNITKFMSTFTD
jgi:hypothetical protein